MAGNGMSVMTINDLHDEILEKIFGYLPMRNLIRLERVCKRWQNVSRTSWRYKMKLDIVQDLGKNFPDAHVTDILMRGGRYLSHLSFDNYALLNHILFDEDKGFPYEESLFKTISSQCHQLISLKVNVLDGSGSTLRLIDKSILKNLKCLHINMFKMGGYDLEDKITAFLKNAVSLEELKVQAETGVEGFCLLNIPKTVKILSVDGCQCINGKILGQVMENLPNVTSLNIDGTLLRPKDVKQFCGRLDSLTVGWIEKFFKDGQFKTLSLENLKVFEISDVAMKDEFFLALMEKLPSVEHLTLKGMRKMKEEDFQHIGILKNLKYLNLSRNKKITDETLKYLAGKLNKLEQFICEDCKLLKQTGLLSLVDSCQRLKYMKVENPEVSNEFFKSALTSVYKRPDNVPLTVHFKFAPLNCTILKYYNDRPGNMKYIKVLGEDIFKAKIWDRCVDSTWYVSTSQEV